MHELLLVYSFSPLQVLRVPTEEAKGAICEVTVVQPQNFRPNAPVGRVRGGSRFVEGLVTSEGEQIFWSLAHSANVPHNGKRSVEKKWPVDSYRAHLIALKATRSLSSAKGRKERVAFETVGISCPLVFDAGEPILGFQGRMVYPSQWDQKRVVNPTSIVNYDAREDRAEVTLMVDDSSHYLVELSNIGLWLREVLAKSQETNDGDAAGWDSYVEGCFRQLPDFISPGCLYSPERAKVAQPQLAFAFSLSVSERQSEQYTTTQTERWEVHTLPPQSFSPGREGGGWYIYAPNDGTLTVDEATGVLYLNHATPGIWDRWSWDGLRFHSVHEAGPGSGTLTVDPTTGQLYINTETPGSWDEFELRDCLI
ncbi:hypothetical protein CYMTET_23901 [Cymbomonas tetramitiformis]|uniref:Uncharacterized protein n=1 Tax=Cymbomonas tetramitiformis TaxID=36881 RepID=A0AAE0FXG9_9CHLO|nr:hypothetical protein CYMTET_23901 [Cymbomonas tetramitiformis]